MTDLAEALWSRRLESVVPLRSAQSLYTARLKPSISFIWSRNSSIATEILETAMEHYPYLAERCYHTPVTFVAGSIKFFCGRFGHFQLALGGLSD